MLIYDNQNDLSISLRYKEKISDFLERNKDFSFNIVYSIKTYSFFSYSLAIKKYDDIKNENEKLEKKYDDIKNDNKLLSKEITILKNDYEEKIKNLTSEIEKLKVQIKGASNQNQVDKK